MTNHKKLSVNVSFIPNITKPIRGYTTMLRKSNDQQALLKFRRDTQQAMNRINYMNEYDRIAGVLDKTVKHGHHDFNRLQNRHNELKHLYLQSFDPETIKQELHDYYKNKKINIM